MASFITMAHIYMVKDSQLHSIVKVEFLDLNTCDTIYVAKLQ